MIRKVIGIALLAVLLQIGPANAGAEGEELKKSNSSANTAN